MLGPAAVKRMQQQQQQHTFIHMSSSDVCSVNPLKQVNRGGANALPLRLYFPPAVSTESFHRACRDRTGPDRTGSPCVCDVFRVQQQRERSAASVMSRPGKRSFQAALIFLSVAHLTAGTARGDRGATTGDRGRKQQEQKQVLS